MDFNTHITPAGGLSTLACDALLVVVVGTMVPAGLDKSVAALLDDAVKHGDFEFKAGRCLYLHRPAGLKAARLAYVAAADGSAKALKAAIAAGLSQLKALGVAEVAVASVGGEALTAAHATTMPGTVPMR